MKLLIIGYGSIGARHARLAAELKAEVACVSNNPDCPYKTFPAVEIACSTWMPDRILIANATNKHLSALMEIEKTQYSGDILIEKPIFDQASSYQPKSPDKIFVAYNLRFHPLIKELKKQLGHRKIFSAEFHVGQYLPDWRPGTDYRDSYSAYAEQGGGVLRDLSHEIDLAFWLCGAPERVIATGGKLSELEITSDDVFMSLVQTAHCKAVSISLNYLNKVPQRLIRINAEELTLTLDLVAGKLDLNGQLIEHRPDRDDQYTSQIDNFMNGNKNDLCSYIEGINIMEFIAQSEYSMKTNSWESIVKF
jgi:predicted dehydrogenase